MSLRQPYTDKCVTVDVSAMGGHVRIKRKREVTVETAEVLIIKTGANEVRCWECGESMMTVQAAVAATGVSSREIHRRVEAGAVHFAETVEGLLLVCLNSLNHGLV